MSLLDRLERRFGVWTIPQFPLFIVTAQGSIFLLSATQPDFIYRLILDPEAVRHGEWWRLFTFLFVPPAMGTLWLVFWLYLLYQYALALEQEWGGFRFTVFYAIGAIATIAVAMYYGEPLSNFSLYTTIFLAFAALYPDFQLLLFFILPLKVKYIAYIIWLIIFWNFWEGSLVTRAGIAASLLNYLLFFGGQHWQTLRLKIEVYRNRRRFRP